MSTANKVLQIERGEIGYSRWNDPLQGTKYGRWLASKTGQAWLAQNGIAFCAMGQSWSFDQAGQACPGMPTAACGVIREAAKKARRVVDRKSAQAGDIVLFRWDGNIDDDSYSDHVGIVEMNLGRGLGIQTIEFNTGNGQVLRRTRSWNVVQYIIRPPYDEVDDTPVIVRPTHDIITVDGIWGENTTRSIQIQAGCPYKDGIVSRQNPKHRWRLAGCNECFQFVYPDGEEPGSYAVKSIQKKFGLTPDGILGPDTINALIAWGMKHDSGATKQDGKLDWKSPTIKTMQRKLNDWTFFK